MEWNELAIKIIATYALAGAACALPGNYLLLRRQSMMGDALSHTSLLGIVLAFLASNLISQYATDSHDGAAYHWMFPAAVLMGILASFLTETIHRLGRVESSAALGVVFTSMFATALLLMRLVDTAHIDVDCVLYGSLVNIVFDEVSIAGHLVPRGIVFNGGIFLINVTLVFLFYKELAITTFDPNLSSALGRNATWTNYAVMAVTSVTIVAVFESVGSIIAIAMLVVPPATAYLLTNRLERMLLLSVIIGGASAVLGWYLAAFVPRLLLPLFGFEVASEGSIAGMTAAAAGGLFFAAFILSPNGGLIQRWFHSLRLKIDVTTQDYLGLVYRLEERQVQSNPELACQVVANHLGYSRLTTRLAVWRLLRRGYLVRVPEGYSLTETGRATAVPLVRAHRLWEAYLEKHFNLPSERLHESAHRVEHYLDPGLREDLSAELDQPRHDPHGRRIPNE